MKQNSLDIHIMCTLKSNSSMRYIKVFQKADGKLTMFSQHFPKVLAMFEMNLTLDLPNVSSNIYILMYIEHQKILNFHFFK